MRLICLNTWGGRAMHPLMHFFKKYGPTTDVFCLQEMFDTTQEHREKVHPDEYVRWDLWEQTKKALPGHVGHFARWHENPHRMSVATFVRRGWEHESTDGVVHVPKNIREHGSEVISPRKLAHTIVRHPVSGRDLHVFNYHGMWDGHDKGDSPERIEQSRRLVNITEYVQGPKVLCGDMNFHPGTESFDILAQPFHEELVTKFALNRGTRTPLFRLFGQPGGEKFADYLFVQGVIATNFHVMEDVVSDHAPMRVDLDW